MEGAATIVCKLDLGLSSISVPGTGPRAPIRHLSSIPGGEFEGLARKRKL